MAENIFAEDFFNIPSPTSPWISIQVRTSFDVSGGKIINDNWEDITLDPSNYFDSFTLEDKSGFYHVTLSLLDKNFANLENILMKTITASRLANELNKSPNYSDSTNFFNFIISNSINANLRIRFGYSIWGEDYIDEVRFSSDDYVNRVKSKKPVIRSPWIYLQILGLKTSFSSSGFKAELNCYSTTNSFLDRAKMIQKFAKLVGKPEDVITQVGKLIEDSSNGEIKIEIDKEEPPKALNNSEGKKEIEIELGGEPIKRDLGNGEIQIIPTYRSLRRLFDLIVSKIEPKKYKLSGESVQVNNDDNGTEIDSSNEDVGAIAKYGYFIRQIEEGDKVKNKITFKYLDAIKSGENQKYLRTYSWLNSGHSIIQDFSIENGMDYAQMNAPIVLINKDGKSSNFVGGGNKIKKDDIKSQNDFKINVIKNISEGLKDGDFKAFFTSSVLSSAEEGDMKTNPNQDASKYATRMMQNINDAVFKGSIVIPGDPFYLFDGTIVPYVYTIKIIVRRPNYYDKDGNFVDGGISYLSGNYVISTITHSITSSGYTTKLDVIRFPLPSKEK